MRHASPTRSRCMWQETGGSKETCSFYIVSPVLYQWKEIKQKPNGIHIPKSNSMLPAQVPNRYFVITFFNYRHAYFLQLIQVPTIAS